MSTFADNEERHDKIVLFSGGFTSCLKLELKIYSAKPLKGRMTLTL